ncbi:hypothetical protein KCP70_17385 [Salmonella enterica subsp. enterica]|nr:hypothetical protein KCP70_17385 [Salmonella enterica subsp. enterica]
MDRWLLEKWDATGDDACLAVLRNYLVINIAGHQPALNMSRSRLTPP